MKLWRADLNELVTKHVECPDGGFPARDADGKKIFDNTHFQTEEEAWDAIERDVSAHLTMSAQGVEEQQRRLQERCDEAVTAAIRWKNLQKNRAAKNKADLSNEFKVGEKVVFQIDDDTHVCAVGIYKGKDEKTGNAEVQTDDGKFYSMPYSMILGRPIPNVYPAETVKWTTGGSIHGR